MKFYILERHAEFFRTGMKALWDEGGGRMLLGNNTGGGALELRADLSLMFAELCSGGC